MSLSESDIEPTGSLLVTVTVLWYQVSGEIHFNQYFPNRRVNYSKHLTIANQLAFQMCLIVCLIVRIRHCTYSDSVSVVVPISSKSPV
jgi:hypothetical protein